MTRRIVKPQPIIDEDSGRVFDGAHKRSPFDIHNWKDPFVDNFSRWMPGDVLWVRETWQQCGKYFHYKASDSFASEKWRPSIFMPKAACRIWLEVVKVRVERLQDISDDDSIAEGVQYVVTDMIRGYKDYYRKPKEIIESVVDSPKESFLSLWEEINGRESLEANPWVWVVEFKVLSTTGKPATEITGDLVKQSNPDSHAI